MADHPIDRSPGGAMVAVPRVAENNIPHPWEGTRVWEAWEGCYYVDIALKHTVSSDRLTRQPFVWLEPKRQETLLAC